MDGLPQALATALLMASCLLLAGCGDEQEYEWDCDYSGDYGYDPVLGTYVRGTAECRRVPVNGGSSETLHCSGTYYFSGVVDGSCS